MDPSILKQYKVLILDESSTVQDLLSDWLNGVSTITVSSSDELPDEFDSSVVVACLSQAALSGNVDSVVKYILSRNPYCQLVGILPRSTAGTLLGDRFDETIRRPLFKEEFREVIEPRFIAGVYSNLLIEFYDLNASLVAVRGAGKNEDTGKQDTLNKLQDRRGAVQSNLQSLQQRLSSDTTRSIIQTIERHNRYLKEPDPDTEEGRGSKNRPRRCPSCNLSWGVNHKSDLGEGYKRLGANVYQCTRCDRIVHGLSPGDRVV